MGTERALIEFRSQWLLHAPESAIDRLIDLLESQSPLLIHGAFTRAPAMGCMATHIAWNHPETCHLEEDAGIRWLTHIAKLNPATSEVVLQWDRIGFADWEFRTGLIAACRKELQYRCVEKSDWPAFERDFSTSTLATEFPTLLG